MASGGKHITVTMLLVAIFYSLSLSLFIIITAFLGGVFIDFDHLLHFATAKRLIKGGSGDKISYFHSLIGTVLFIVISGLAYWEGLIGWWLPIVCYIIHAALDTFPGKFFCGNNTYPTDLWYKLPHKFNMPGLDDSEEQKVSLIFTVMGWLSLSIVIEPASIVITSLIMLALVLWQPSKIKAFAVNFINLLLVVSWLIYFCI